MSMKGCFPWDCSSKVCFLSQDNEQWRPSAELILIQSLQKMRNSAFESNGDVVVACMPKPKASVAVWGKIMSAHQYDRICDYRRDAPTRDIPSWTQLHDARSDADFIQDDSALQYTAAYLFPTHTSPKRYAARSSTTWWAIANTIHRNMDRSALSFFLPPILSNSVSAR